MAINTLKFIEDAGIGLRLATKGLIDAISVHNPFCIAESTLETGSSFSQLLYYAAWLPNKLHTYDIYPIDGVTEGLAIVGIAANVFKFGKETLSFARQQQFLRIFTNYAWKPKQVVKTLTKISELSPEKLDKIFPDATKFTKLFNAIKNGDQPALESAREQLLKGSVETSLQKIIKLDNTEIERALPEWLFKDITDKGGQEYFKKLLDKVQKGDPAAINESVKVLETMRSYARKKTILHVLGMISAIIGIVGCIGLLTAFPFVATVVLLLLVVILGIATYTVRKGYVENPDGGFSLDRCIPEFMKKKADPYNDLPPYLQRISASVLEQKPSALFDFSRPAHRVLHQKRARSFKVSSHNLRKRLEPTSSALEQPRPEKPKKKQHRLNSTKQPMLYAGNF